MALHSTASGEVGGPPRDGGPTLPWPSGGRGSPPPPNVYPQSPPDTEQVVGAAKRPLDDAGSQQPVFSPRNPVDEFLTVNRFWVVI